MTESKELKSKKIDNIYNLIIGQRVRDLRIIRKMTQTELAEKCLITFQQIGKYEKGINALSLRRANLLCKALNVDVNYLTYGVLNETKKIRYAAATSDSITTEVNNVERN